MSWIHFKNIESHVHVGTNFSMRRLSAQLAYLIYFFSSLNGLSEFDTLFFLLKLLFEELLERAKEKEEKETKKRQRLADDFTNLLYTLKVDEDYTMI